MTGDGQHGRLFGANIERGDTDDIGGGMTTGTQCLPGKCDKLGRIGTALAAKAENKRGWRRHPRIFLINHPLAPTKNPYAKRLPVTASTAPILAPPSRSAAPGISPIRKADAIA